MSSLVLYPARHRHVFCRATHCNTKQQRWQRVIVTVPIHLRRFFQISRSITTIVFHRGHNRWELEGQPQLEDRMARIFGFGSTLFRRFPHSYLLRNFTRFSRSNGCYVSAIAVTNVLNRRSQVVTASDGGGTKNSLQMMALATVTTRRHPFNFTQVRFVPTMAAMFVQSMGLHRLCTSSNRLGRPGVRVGSLACQPRVIAPLLLCWPGEFPLPFTSL